MLGLARGEDDLQALMLRPVFFSRFAAMLASSLATSLPLISFSNRDDFDLGARVQTQRGPGAGHLAGSL